ncbi:hypothetical protein BCR35DRAFT_65622 [Leucosporidium creatinivorum]|uniref:Uncharacterized protein n=1 Tax=Leucosporidium creatinivorum TaxID=106004 RepID=A0A1Y2FHY6_9BASI|nr:hypothetical protein BCR35DRAFT_65622 [Leucosporidium creatinivorum]
MASALDMTELSDALKDELATALQNGNAAYKMQDWDAAIEAYSAALALDSTSVDSAKTWANRAATYIQTQQCDLALMDAQKAVKLNPSSSKGYSRQAESFAYLQDFAKAHHLYTLAIEHAENDAVRGRLATAAAKVKQRQVAASKHVPSGIKTYKEADPEPATWVKRLEELQREGYVALPGSAAHLVMVSRQHCENSLQLLAGTGPVPGHRDSWRAQIGSNVLDGFAESMLKDQRGFFLPPYNAAAPMTSPSYKLQREISFQFQQLDLLEWQNQTTPPREIVAAMDARRKRDGWKRLREGMIVLVKAAVVCGQLNCYSEQFGPGVSNYRFALGLLEEGEKMWKDVPYGDRAQMYRPSFVRMVRVGLMQAILDGHTHARTKSAKLAYKPSEVLQMGKTIIEDAKGDSYAEMGNTSWLSSHTMAMARARIAHGQVYFLNARENAKEDSKLKLFDTKYMGHAASAFRRACDLLPHDYPSRPTSMYFKLACSLYAGGLSLNQVFAEAAAAEASYVEPERLFGPISREEAPRLFVRRQCENARRWLETQEGGLEVHGEKILKPVVEIDVPAGPNASNAAQKYMDSELWEAQVGEVGLCDLVDTG